MGIGASEGQGRVIDEVIKRGICIRCGACVGLCPYFDYFDGRVVVLDQCNSDTWRCLQLCPRFEYESTDPDKSNGDISKNNGMGTYRKIVMARSTDDKIIERAQYGGTVSALFMFALEKGDIKSVVLTDAGGPFSPGGKFVTNNNGILDCAGSRYSGSGGLSALNRAIKAGEDKIGVVGLPCQMEALARLNLMKPDGEERSKRVVLKIGLFCTWALDYRLTEEFLKSKGMEGIIKKYDIPPPPSEKFQVLTEMGWTDFSLSDLRPLVQKGCALCQDMTALWSDLSVGTVEGVEGWNTVVIRTETGARLVERAVGAGCLEIQDLPGENLEHLKEAAHNKLEKAQKERARRSKS
jgi:coenzyme F420 hydrogenase subunit beta